jgi:hypothetical protein
VEVIDSKSSVASSEERLAAGISTIGLHTKRLSGAQWRKLTRERRMSKGTWMGRKLPRKTPSSDRSAVGSSRGVKTSLRLKHTNIGKTATENTQEHFSTDWIV